MNQLQDIAIFALRISLGAGFLSAVFSRFGWWGSKSSGWNGFLSYASQVNSFLPDNFHRPLAYTSTFLEFVFGILLIAGYKTSLVACGSGILTLAFIISMSISFGIKDPLDYSVFAFSTGAFLLATMPYYKWSVDQLLTK
jgi:putative oxidoreductase